MAVTDSPDTRIKAADARDLWRAPARDGLGILGGSLGFQALALITFDQQRVGTPWSKAWASVTYDEDIIGLYAHNLARRAEPQVAAARGVVVFGIHSDGMAEVATWGETASDCARLGQWGGELLKNLPVCPFQTWFGWGNCGVPKRMDAERLAELSAAQLNYVEKHTHSDAVA